MLSVSIMSVANAATASDRIQLLLRNAKQMKKIVEATFPSLNFDDKVRDISTECGGKVSSGGQLACKWQGVVQVMETVATVHPKLRVDHVYWVCLNPTLTSQSCLLLSLSVTYSFGARYFASLLTYISSPALLKRSCQVLP